MKFNELLDFCATSDILRNTGTIVVLGDPRFEIPDADGRKPKAFTYWTGASFHWDNQPGDTIKISESGQYAKFREYAKHLRKWNYSLGECSLNKTTFEEQWDLNALHREGLSASVQVLTACSNRYGHALAFCIGHRIGDKYHVHVPYGLIYFLPETSLDADETLLIVLRDFCGAARRNLRSICDSPRNCGVRKPAEYAIIYVAGRLAVVADDDGVGEQLGGDAADLDALGRERDDGDVEPCCRTRRGGAFPCMSSPCGVRKSDRPVPAADPRWSADPPRALTHP